ncbi:hypothetical protein ABIF93_008432 [Bradyrhizobium japonicum]
MRQVFSTVTAGMSSAATNGWAALARRGPVLWLTVSAPFYAPMQLSAGMG